MSAIKTLEQLAQDTTAKVEELSAHQLAEIELLKAKADEMNAIMAIIEPTDPDEPAKEPEDEPEK